MIPISDNFPSRRTPVITRILVLANILVFLQELGLDEETLPQLFFYYGVVPARYTHENLTQYFTLPQQAMPFITSQFLHGGWLHLIGNMVTLWIFGDNVEDRMGRLKFLLFYLLMGMAAATAEIVTSPGSHMPVIGASGAIAGVMGAYFLLFPRARVVLLVPILFFIDFWEVPAPLFFTLWFVIQSFSGAMSLMDAEGIFGGIAWWAHIGGFAGGMFIGLILRVFSGNKRRILYLEDYEMPE